QNLDEVQGGRFALDGGIRGQNDLPNTAFRYSFHKAFDSKVVGTHAVDRGNGPHQHVVQPPVLVDGLDGQNTARLLDAADRRPVPLRVRADRAGIHLGVGPAHAAGANRLAELREV